MGTSTICMKKKAKSIRGMDQQEETQKRKEMKRVDDEVAEEGGAEDRLIKKVTMIKKKRNV